MSNGDVCFFFLLQLKHLTASEGWYTKQDDDIWVVQSYPWEISLLLEKSIKHPLPKYKSNISGLLTDYSTSLPYGQINEI